jgi:hypothetical protein
MTGHASSAVPDFFAKDLLQLFDIERFLVGKRDAISDLDGNGIDGGSPPINPNSN